jgi:hypothetical protein
MAWLDDVWHITDNWPWMDFVNDTELRYRFCQWSQIGLWKEEKKRGIV